MKGLGHAILTGRTLIGDNAFAVILADDFCVADPEYNGVMAQMVKLYNQFRCSIVAYRGSTGRRDPQVRRDCRRYHKGRALPDYGHGGKTTRRTRRPRISPSSAVTSSRRIFSTSWSTPSPARAVRSRLPDALLEQARDGCVLAYQFKRAGVSTAAALMASWKRRTTSTRTSIASRRKGNPEPGNSNADTQSGPRDRSES